MAMLRAPVACGVADRAGVHTRGPASSGFRGCGDSGGGAAASDAGAEEVVLFADLANPVSNSIYQRIGFEPVSDWVRIGFATARVP